MTNSTDEKLISWCEHGKMLVCEICALKTEANTLKQQVNVWCKKAQDESQRADDYQKQVNTLTEATNIAACQLERLERTLFLGLPEQSRARNCYRSIVRTLTEALQSIKESPREEQTK